jgi:Gnt-I system high-affinity gluconate transporter
VGIPMLAALSVTHGLLPPHPSPAALVNQLQADMGKTLIYGLIIALPTIILAGPLFASTLKKINTVPLQTFASHSIDEKLLPGFTNSIVACLLPVFILITTSIFELNGFTIHPILKFISDPGIIMLVSLMYATLTLGVGRGMQISYIMQEYAEAIKDILLIIMVIAGAGALKQVFVESGVSTELANAMNNWTLPPLFLGWLIAAVIRVTMGSATVAGLTTAGIVAPLVMSTGTDANLMVLAVGSGSLMFSHVNDSGFWMFKEYFNLSMRDTFRSWSLMETIVSVMGLIGVLLIDQFI